MLSKLLQNIFSKNSDLIPKSVSLVQIVITTLGSEDSLKAYLPLWNSTVDLHVVWKTVCFK